MFKENRLKSVILIVVCTLLLTAGTSLVWDVSSALAEQQVEVSSPSQPIGSISPATADGVFYVSTSGKDSNPGTYQRPWRTINKAARTLAPGQTAIVLAGNYPERINLTRSGITLKTQGKVTMKGFEVHGNNNRIIGFKISDRNSDAGLEVHGNGNLFTRNEIYHMG